MRRIVNVIVDLRSDARGFPQFMTTGFLRGCGGGIGRPVDFQKGFPLLNPLGSFNPGRSCWLDPPLLLAAIRPLSFGVFVFMDE
jgi:hypothetical protein